MKAAVIGSWRDTRLCGVGLRDLSPTAGLLSPPGGRYTSADGTDCRNYGGPEGLLELREIFSGFLQVPAGQLLAVGDSSLELMHDCLVHALLGTLPGAARRWADEERIAFLCPVPGYDRHFALCERFGIDVPARRGRGARPYARAP
ncbi:hypothetical protein ACIRU8_19750 [Streptomyces sp. NPDC101175]|uniref:hypothetical protein n=1 Tax=Streptomyces sp. NPDC101175 TaxID=3366123 RepID=UPI003838E645